MRLYGALWPHTRLAGRPEEIAVEKRGKAWRRHQIHKHMWKRLKEVRNQHYNDIVGFFWTDAKTIARLKEQPKLCSCGMCSNLRSQSGPTIQERRWRG